jgi:hypothetical protein
MEHAQVIPKAEWFAHKSHGSHESEGNKAALNLSHCSLPNIRVIRVIRRQKLNTNTQHANQ